MKNDSTSFFENNHFANSYVYDISISHVPAYFGLHWHHYIEIVLAQDNGIIYEVNGETFPLKPGDLLFIWPGELHAVSTTNREHRLNIGSHLRYIHSGLIAHNQYTRIIVLRSRLNDVV